MSEIYTTRGLALICKDGVDSITAQLKELEQYGYLSRRRLRDENGRITDWSTSSMRNLIRLYQIRIHHIRIHHIRLHHIRKTRIWLRRIWKTHVQETPRNEI